jgi:hypothetical protein
MPTDLWSTRMAERIAPLVYGTVVGRFLAAIVDAPTDNDDDPDGVPLSGTVTFTPTVTVFTVPKATPAPATVLPMPITAALDAEGYLGVNGKRGVNLIATNDPATLPTGFTYAVAFNGLRYNGQPVTYQPFNIEVPSGSVIDLGLVAPVPADGGTAVIPDAAVARTAVAEMTGQLTGRIDAAAQAASQASAAILALSGRVDNSYPRQPSGIPKADLAEPVRVTLDDAAYTNQRFGPYAQLRQADDANVLVISGQYRGPNMTNTPYYGPWWFIEVVAHGGDYVTQRATGFTQPVTGMVYVRNLEAAQWGPWKLIGGGDTKEIPINNALWQVLPSAFPCTLRRVDNTVTLRIINFTMQGNSNNPQGVFAVPPGFRSYKEEVGQVFNEVSNTLTPAFIYDTGELILRNLPNNGGFNKLTMSWHTDETWPTSLPVYEPQAQ